MSTYQRQPRASIWCARIWQDLNHGCSISEVPRCLALVPAPVDSRELCQTWEWLRTLRRAPASRRAFFCCTQLRLGSGGRLSWTSIGRSGPATRRGLRDRHADSGSGLDSGNTDSKRRLSHAAVPQGISQCAYVPATSRTHRRRVDRAFLEPSWQELYFTVTAIIVVIAWLVTDRLIVSLGLGKLSCVNGICSVATRAPVLP